MSKFKFVSAKEIMARVIRSLGYKLPSTYQDDVLEWIGEGIGFIQVTNSLVYASTGECGDEDELICKNHCVSLPCGFVSILAVENEYGARLAQSSGVSSNSRYMDNSRISVFETNPYWHQTSDGLPTDKPGTSIPLYGEDIHQATEVTNGSFYDIRGNYLQTSFESGFVRVHYLSVPVDKEGYPLIPDNENFKQAIEWHIIKRLVGSGYEHKVFNYDYADQQYEKYAARAMNEVSYYTPDGAARAHKSLIRLIPPENYGTSFFN